MIVTVVLPEVLTVVAGTEQVTSIKLLETVQVNETLPLKLFCGVTVIVDVAELPGWIVSMAGAAVS